MSLDRVTHGTGLFSDDHKWETAVLPSFGDAHTHTHTSYQNAIRKKSNIVHNFPKRRHTKKRARITVMLLLTK